MLFAFHMREPMSKQHRLADTLIRGVAKHGDEIVKIEGFKQVEDVDGLILYGIGGLGEDHALIPFKAYREAGKRILFFDKGYTRNDNYRVSVDDFQPLAYLMVHKRPHDRLAALNLPLNLPRKLGNFIVFDGASEKFCDWKEFGDWQAWGQCVVWVIKQHTNLPVIYRPRRGRNEIPCVDGAETSTTCLAMDLARARVVVSWGGNIGWDCVAAGVPHFAIGDSIARPVSETDWTKLAQPFIPSQSDRLQWQANVAYCQWTTEELANGIAWAHIKEQLLLVYINHN